MSKMEFNPPMQRPPEVICSLCAKTGLVFREGVLKACLCPLGRAPGVRVWNGHRIHPEDQIGAF